MDVWTDQPTPLQDIAVRLRVRVYAQRPNSARRVLVRDRTITTLITEPHENVIAVAGVSVLRYAYRNASTYTVIVDNEHGVVLSEWEWCRDCHTLHNLSAHPHLKKREPTHDACH